MKKTSCTQGSLLDMPTPEKKTPAMPDMKKSMSRLERLMEELCPNGVEYKELWEITIWDKRFHGVEKEKQPIIINYPYLLANELFELEQKNGNVFLLSTGERTGWTTEDIAKGNICKGEVVAIPWGKSRPIDEVIKYYCGKFVTSDNRIATSNDISKFSNKYLYYLMLNYSRKIDSFYRGSGIKHPSMKDILNMKVPVPPLPVQEEIVRILDTFSELTSELTSELNKRKQQYQYYREKLLIHDLKDMKKITLGDVGRVSMCKRIMKAETSSEGDVPFYKIGTFGKEPDAYISRKQYEEYKRLYSYPKKGDILISASGTIGRTVIYNGEDAYYQDSNIVWIDNDETKILNKFLYYFYQLQPWSVSDGGTISRLYNDNINRTPIPVPPLEEQERIVSILDRFDALCNDLTSGLPAEIEARKKQYEYYRDKLLTFKEAK